MEIPLLTDQQVDQHSLLPEQYTVADQNATSRDYFDALLHVASWNQEGDFAWFKPDSRHRASLGLKRRTGPGIIVQRIVEIQHSGHEKAYAPEPGIATPEWLDEPSDMPVVYHYRRWTLGSSQEIEDHMRTVRPEDLRQTFVPRAEMHPARQETSYRNAIVPSVSYLFSKVASSYADLSHYAKAYLQWLGKPSDVTRHKEAAVVPEALAARSVLLATKYGSFGDVTTNPALDTLSDISPEHPAYPFLTGALSVGMAKLILKQELQSHKDIYGAISEAAVGEVTAALDKLGLLTSDFWLDAGMTGGEAALRNKTFLKLLHGKIVQDKGEVFTAGKEAIDTGRILRTYMTNLLRIYAQDPRHDITQVQRILRRTLSEEDHLIDATALTTVANDMAKGWNGRLADPITHHRLFDPAVPRDTINALLRVLSVTLFSGIPEVAKQQLRKEHRFHAEILAGLTELALPEHANFVPHQRS